MRFKPKRRLRCSFCSKSESAKLIAGRRSISATSASASATESWTHCLRPSRVGMRCAKISSSPRCNPPQQPSVRPGRFSRLRSRPCDSAASVGHSAHPAKRHGSASPRPASASASEIRAFFQLLKMWQKCGKTPQNQKKPCCINAIAARISCLYIYILVRCGPVQGASATSLWRQVMAYSDAREDAVMERDRDEDESMVLRTVFLPRAMDIQLREIASREGVSKSALIRNILRGQLER